MIKMNIKHFSLAASAVCAALLAGCTSVSLAPIDDRSGQGQPQAPIVSPAPEVTVQTVPVQDGGAGKYYAPQAAVSDSGRTHTVASGDTLYNIGVRYGVSPSELQRLNGISDPTALSLGQVLKLPEAKVAEQPAASIETPSVTVEDVSRPMAASTARRQQEQARKALEESAATSSAVVMPWPVRGDVISSFRENHMGIDIAGREGTPVKAVLDGTVQYVGNNTRGYGNFVIIRHNSRLPGKGMTPLVTVYGNCSQILVSINESVRKGQTIAKMGKTDSERVKLRFEVRQGKPLDPLDYLEK
jgi:lipoprotein NlpD